MKLEFTVGNQIISCTEDRFHAEIPGGTTKKLTIVPTFGGSGFGHGDGPCLAGGFPVTIDENGCHFEIYTLETEPHSAHTWRATTRLQCPAGVPGIQWTVFGSANHTVVNRVCTVTYFPQEGVTGITLHSNLKAEHADLTMTFNLENVTRTQQGLCGHAHGVAGIHGAVTLQGTSADEEGVNLYVAHTEE